MHSCRAAAGSGQSSGIWVGSERQFGVIFGSDKMRSVDLEAIHGKSRDSLTQSTVDSWSLASEERMRSLLAGARMSGQRKKSLSDRMTPEDAPICRRTRMGVLEPTAHRTIEYDVGVKRKGVRRCASKSIPGTRVRLGSTLLSQLRGGDNVSVAFCVLPELDSGLGTLVPGHKQGQNGTRKSLL